MGKILAPLMALLRRPWLLVALIVLVGGAAVGGPYLWAWYHFRAGRTALERYHHAEARDHLEACLRIWPRDPNAHLLAARAARRAGDFAEASRHLRECQRLQGPPNSDTVLEWSLYKAAMGDLEEIEDFLQGEARKYPALAPLILEAMADGYLRVFRNLDALSCLDIWLEQQPDNVQALVQRGNAWLQCHSPQKAAPDYRRALELDPERQEVHWWLGLCLLDIGRYEEALGHLEQVRQQKPEDLDVQVRLGRCYSRLGRTKQARQMLEAVLARQADYGPALLTMGQIELLAGQPAEAEAWLHRAVKVLPNDYSINWSLAECLQQQGKGAEAKAQMARAQEIKNRTERLGEISTRLLSMRPHDPALHYELGKLLLDQGQTERGLSWLRSAVNKDPGYQPANQALADYYQAQGDAENAAYFRQQAARTQPKGSTPTKN
jgi:tetratricopeptide (TPR) repeat protein